MSTTRIRSGAGATLEGGREAPAEIQLWNVGDNPTDYGVHVWNARSVAEVTARYTDRGNPILLDVEHSGARLEDGEPAVTAGYAKLEIRGGAPWLVFEWSDFGREQIVTGQRRFLSPEYDVDKSTGEILALYRVSLVADPGTHRARMLAAALEKVRTMDIALVLAALRAALAAEDPAVAKESIANLVSELSKSAGDVAPDGEPMPEAAAGAPPAQEPAANDGPPADEKKPPTKASAPEPAGERAPGKPATVEAVAASAVRQIENAQRDHLLATRGEGLEPSLRRWASAQPLAVVSSFLDAMPAKPAGLQRAKATRGNVDEHGLTDRELQKCKAKGVDPAKYAALKQSFGGT